MRTTLITLLLSITILIQAQDKNGMVLDNYAGTIATQYNPANLADSRFQFHMNVIGFNAGIQNNYLQLEAPHSLYKFLNFSLDSNFGTQNFDYPFEEYYAKERLNGNDKFVFMQGEVDYLHMQIGLKDRSGISIHFSTKSYASISNLPESALKTFLQDYDTLGRTKENQYRLLGDECGI